MQGVVKNIKEQSGFGFITPDEWKGDLFFHFSALEGWVNTFNSLKVWQRVEFDVIPWKKEWTQQASKISLINE